MGVYISGAIEKRINQLLGDRSYLCKKMKSLHDALDAMLDSGSPRWSSVATLASEISATAMYIDGCDTELKSLQRLLSEFTRPTDFSGRKMPC